MALALDGSATSTTVTSNVGTVTLTTANAGDVIGMAVARANGAVVSSISSSNTTGWAKRATITRAGSVTDLWYGSAAAALSSEVISVNFATSPSSTRMVAFGISGGPNTASPGDPNASLPAATAGGASPQAQTISTTTANGFAIGLLGESGSSLGTVTRPSAFTQIINAGASFDVSYSVLTGTLSSVAEQWSWTGGANAALIVDVVQPAGGTVWSVSTSLGTNVTEAGAAAQSMVAAPGLAASVAAAASPTLGESASAALASSAMAAASPALVLNSVASLAAHATGASAATATLAAVAALGSAMGKAASAVARFSVGIVEAMAAFFAVAPAAPAPALDVTRRFLRVAPVWSYAARHPAYGYAVRTPALAYLATIPEMGMPALHDLPPIDPLNQVQTVAIDFGDFLPAGVTLAGTPTAQLSVHSGNDPAPAARVTSGPVVGTASADPPWNGSGVANAAVLVQLGGLLAGASYTLWVWCARSDGDVASGWTRIPASPSP